MNEKRKHHFIARTYLKGFSNLDGKVCVYWKDRPTEPRWTSPDAIAFENYYYSQPTPDGGRDNNRIEDFFASIENNWPLIVEKLKKRDRHAGGLNQLLEFAVMHRVRVPTARDAVEKILASSVRMTMRHLNDKGALPTPPDGLDFDYLEEITTVSIDPHRSIHAMSDLANGMKKIFQHVGFEIVENQTEDNFLTTDNPAIYFDPTISSLKLQPYNIDRKRMDIEFMFPITPRLMLWGHSKLRPRSGSNHVAYYRKMTDKMFVRRANVLAARFANRMIFSNEDRHRKLAVKYAGKSPVVSTVQLKAATGRGVFFQHVFGEREIKPKWQPTGDM